MHRKVSIIGGGGVRTPLLIHGLLRAQSELNIGEMRLFDADVRRAELMASLGREIASDLRVDVRITGSESMESAIEGSDFVLSSLRIGGMAARAAMSASRSPKAWPARKQLVRAALPWLCEPCPLLSNTPHRGTPGSRSMVHQLHQSRRIDYPGVASAHQAARGRHLRHPGRTSAQDCHVLGEPPCNVQCDYAGLNHLGWVRRVRARGMTSPIACQTVRRCGSSSCRTLRSPADPHPQSHSLGIFVLLTIASAKLTEISLPRVPVAVRN